MSEKKTHRAVVEFSFWGFYSFDFYFFLILRRKRQFGEKMTVRTKEKKILLYIYIFDKIKIKGRMIFTNYGSRGSRDLSVSTTNDFLCVCGN